MGSVRDSEDIEIFLNAYMHRQLCMLQKEVPGAIAIDELPLARIKRIMKQDSCDPQPRMISADAIPLMAYASQIFVGCLTSLAWQLSTAPSKRNTLQAKDLKAAIAASSHFDFLIDVVDLFDQQALEQQKASEQEKSNAAGDSWSQGTIPSASQPRSQQAGMQLPAVDECSLAEFLADQLY